MLAVPQVRIGQRDAIGVVIKIHFSTPLRSHRQPWLKNLEIEVEFAPTLVRRKVIVDDAFTKINNETPISI